MRKPVANVGNNVFGGLSCGLGLEGSVGFSCHLSINPINVGRANNITMKLSIGVKGK